MMEYFNTTNISVAIIVLVFFFFLAQLLKLRGLYKTISKVSNSGNILEALSNSKLGALTKSYEESLTITTTQGKKTNIPSSEYFSEDNTCKSVKLNLRLLDTATGTLVGLGLLGTFLGLTLGVKDFDSSDANKIQESIQVLLSGMATAFLTSLAGMTLSIIFTFIDKSCRNRLSKGLYNLTERLDKDYYIDDIALATINQGNMLDRLYTNIQQLVMNQCNSVISTISAETKIVNDKLTYANQDGQVVTMGNAIREILAENCEQSKALKSFSTDLAIELNNGFDESLSRQMQQKILPLMENVDNTTKAIIEHIDKMAEVVSSPATDMIQSVVTELKNCVSVVIDEFKTSLSNSTTNELEGLASQLGTASQALVSFPQNMENISATLQTTIEEVKTAVSEISNTSATANSTAMQQMQEQISYATGAISSAIGEVQEAMKTINQSSQQQTSEMVNKLAEAADKMGLFLNNTISSISTSIQDSMQNITSDINSKQADLISLQEETTTETRKSLESFIEEVKTAVSEISNTSAAANSTAIQQMQEQISYATGAIGSAIGEVQEAMKTINQSSQQQSSEMVSKLTEATDKMGIFLNNTISSLSASVQDSMLNITSDINSKQADLISLQEETTSETRKLLETFNQGLERLEKMNGYISDTMNMFQQAQGHITGSTAHLQTITGDMKTATQLFSKSQSEYASKMEEIQSNNQRGIEAVTALLNQSGELSNDYVEKFEVIKQGLGSIFSQLQNGLTEYSRTVQHTTQKYLDQYSSSLTTTTDALSSTIQQQNEVVEMLVESLNSRKR